MRTILVLVIHLLVIIATLLRAGGVRAVAASIAQQITRAFGVEIDKDVVRRALAGLTPSQFAGALCPAPAALARHGWQQHCRGLFEPPIAA